MKYLTYLIAAALLVIGSSDLAHAANCSAYPYTLTNGQTADANQVMADFNNILSCGNNNLLGKNNNLSDVQSPSTSRTNLGLGAAAVENLSNGSANAITDDGAGNLVGHANTLHMVVFTGTGSFTIPSNATTSTVFEFTVVGGGSGGAGSGSGTNAGTSGSSGGAGVSQFSGFTPGASVTINVGAGGTAGGIASAGSTGGASYVTYSATTIASGGPGSGSGSYQAQPGSPGNFTASAGGSGLTLLGSYPCGSSPGVGGWNGLGTGNPGGSNCVGSGGIGGTKAGATPTVGTYGGGGGSAADSAGAVGAAGGAGVVVVKWVL